MGQRQFWRRRGFDFVDYYRQVQHLSGLWLSPKALLTLGDITVVKAMDWTEGTRPN